MSHPFEDPEGSYRVLVNDEGQYSLWPAATDIPVGWRSVHGPAGRRGCLELIEREWTDMRPASLVAAEERAAAETGSWPGGDAR